MVRSCKYMYCILGTPPVSPSLKSWSVVAEWFGYRTLNQRVVGSNPGESMAWYVSRIPPHAERWPCHSPRNKTHLPEINKPQARISGVELSMCYPVDSNTCTDVTTRVNRLLLDSLKNNFVLGSHCVQQVCMEGSRNTVAWLFLQLNTSCLGADSTIQLSSRVKGM
jgi:hypothetical protein